MSNQEAWKRLAKLYPWQKEPPGIGPKMHGWYLNGPFLQEMVKGKKWAIELGSWFGWSAKFILDHNPELKIVCVDHWAGGPAMGNDPAVKALIAESYDRFRCNLWPYRDRVIAIRTDTIAGMVNALVAGFVPEIGYVDAGHDRDSVIADIHHAYRTWPEIILCGDDYCDGWPGVVSAVNDMAAYHGKKVRKVGNAWLHESAS